MGHSLSLAQKEITFSVSLFKSSFCVYLFGLETLVYRQGFSFWQAIPNAAQALTKKPPLDSSGGGFLVWKDRLAT